MTLRLSARSARGFWHALMANAVALVEDSATLWTNGSPGRARSLLILAQEELARAQAVYDAASAVWDAGTGTVELSAASGRHLSISRDHREKLAAHERNALDLAPFWGDYSAWEDGAVLEPVRDPREIDAEKQAGFYVSAAPSRGGRFESPLDIESTPVRGEITLVARVAEMALIRDHTRRQRVGADGDGVDELHWKLMPYAHPTEYAAFLDGQEGQEPPPDGEAQAP